MKEHLTTFAAMLLVSATVMWITPAWFTAIVEWIVCAAVILWILPNVIFA